MGGHSIKAGRVEYCYNGAWYSVCDNGWDDEQEARVVCNTLGYDTSLGEGDIIIAFDGNTLHKWACILYKLQVKEI